MVNFNAIPFGHAQLPYLIRDFEEQLGERIPFPAHLNITRLPDTQNTNLTALVAVKFLQVVEEEPKEAVLVSSVDVYAAYAEKGKESACNSV